MDRSTMAGPITLHDPASRPSQTRLERPDRPCHIGQLATANMTAHATLARPRRERMAAAWEGEGAVAWGA